MPIPRIATLLAALFLLVLAPMAAAQPTTLSYQGQLQDQGQPFTGNVDLEFRLFDQLSGGTEVASPQTRAAWPVADGLFQVELDFGAGAFNGAERYLQVTVNGTALNPRQRVTATPYAVLAGGLVGGVPETGWSLTGNAGTNPATNFIGTTDNQPLIFRVGGERALQLGGNSSESPNILGGSYVNSIGAGVSGATISGGGSFGGCSASGCPNSVSGNFGTVGGGENNLADSYATVGGGRSNAANGQESTVGGGSENGSTGDLSTIAGGRWNRASGLGGTIGGGAANVASGTSGTVGGGQGNVASGGNSAIGGGISNNASGFASSIAGGIENTAAGNFSFVAGQRAKNSNAAHDGVFMFADSQNADFFSSGPNQFLVRAAGGAAINTSTPRAPLTVQGADNWSPTVGNGFGDFHVGTSTLGLAVGVAQGGGGAGAIRIWGSGGNRQIVFVDSTNQTALSIDPSRRVGVRRFALTNGLEVEGNASKTTSGSWLANSDARIKTDVQEIDGALERLMQVRPVSFRYTDSYRRAHPDVGEGRYYNVIAQEFARVFPEAVKHSGETLPGQEDAAEGEILQVDVHPALITAIAAIQELAVRLEQAEAENADLHARLSALEALLFEDRRASVQASELVQ